jgi:3-hydroxyisobutyrate dehydrogenase
MLPDSPDVEVVVTGSNGVLGAARRGAIVIEMSTISPQVARKIAEEGRLAGVSFLDAPVSGGVTGAESGTLSIMVGGERAAFERALPILQSLGRTITHMGPSGSGQATKLCNQIMCAVNTLGVAEAITLARKAGLDMGKLMQAVGGGSASSWTLANMGPKMIERDWAPGFKIDLQQKDLRLVEEFAESLDTPVLGTTIARQLFRVVQAEGRGGDGIQALLTALEKLAGARIE